MRMKASHADIVTVGELLLETAKDHCELPRRVNSQVDAACRVWFCERDGH